MIACWAWLATAVGLLLLPLRHALYFYMMRGVLGSCDVGYLLLLQHPARQYDDVSHDCTVLFTSLQACMASMTSTSQLLQCSPPNCVSVY
mmetsp:Transcript_11190/g.24094  ORF Transcript_11190/g.24094 Transcript_11190/m.24094 type:complete len:90 (-) Transcript_11190:1369-1638(-)